MFVVKETLFVLACISVCHEISAVDSSRAGSDWKRDFLARCVVF